MWFRGDRRRRRRVLDALAAAGDAGMTPLALAVTTQLPESELRRTVQQLIEQGAVTPWSEPRPSGLLERSGYRLAGSQHRPA